MFCYGWWTLVVRRRPSTLARLEDQCPKLRRMLLPWQRCLHYDFWNGILSCAKKIVLFFYLFYVMVDATFASIHFVKKSMTTKAYLKLPWAVDRGPTMSTPITTGAMSGNHLCLLWGPLFLTRSFLHASHIHATLSVSWIILGQKKHCRVTLDVRALGPICQPHSPLWTSSRNSWPSCWVMHLRRGWVMPFLYRLLSIIMYTWLLYLSLKSLDLSSGSKCSRRYNIIGALQYSCIMMPSGLWHSTTCQTKGTIKTS
jgi:hypothetical protein